VIGRIFVACFMLLSLQAAATDPAVVLDEFNAYPHAVSVAVNSSVVVDYEVGLGAMRKSGGAWKLKESERLSGTLTRYTWQIIDGFTSREVADELSEGLIEPKLMFACEGRSCGPGVQWANRVFHQRILYGREELQRYRVYAGDSYRLIIYDSARTADRQYLHVELLELAPTSQPAAE
jgi:Domain of unknown function (DUF4892)